MTQFYNDIKNMYSLCDWINPDLLDWETLSANPNAITMLEQNIELIDWSALSGNPNAMHILKQHQDKINWRALSGNTDSQAIALLEQNPDKINWYILSGNESYKAVELLKKNPTRCNMYMLSRNPTARDMIASSNKTYPTSKFSKLWSRLESDLDEIEDFEKLEKLEDLDLDSLNWMKLSVNPKAIGLLRKYPERIDMYWFASNPLCERVWLESKKRKEEWYLMSSNKNCVGLLCVFREEIDWRSFSGNPSIFTINYRYLRERNRGLFEELISNRFHPDNIHKFTEWGYDLSWNIHDNQPTNQPTNQPRDL
jgi:hypothetical protein